MNLLLGYICETFDCISEEMQSPLSVQSDGVFFHFSFIRNGYDLCNLYRTAYRLTHAQKREPQLTQPPRLWSFCAAKAIALARCHHCSVSPPLEIVICVLHIWVEPDFLRSGMKFHVCSPFSFRIYFLGEIIRMVLTLVCVSV